jgi:RNA polymerase sigma-70 factor (ECF subfamily)
MSSDQAFHELVQRMQGGDDRAAAELIRASELLVRREVRQRLHDPRQYRVLDTLDICQAILAGFFVRAATGQYDLHQPRHVLKLLTALVQGHLASADACAPEPIGARELLSQVLESLPVEERRLADCYTQGQSWPAIALDLGGTAEGRRRQLAAAVEHTLEELGIGQAPDPHIGSRLGKYRINARLGRGGMGIVYLADDTVLKRPVALKVLPPALSADAERLRRFLREAQAAARLSHPTW